MLPEIALQLCIVSVALLLLIDVRQTNRISVAIWLPIIWMMYCGSRPLTYWFDPESINNASRDATEGSPIDRLFVSILIGVGVVILCRRKIEWGKLVANNVWVVTLFAYMGLSVLWSDLPAVSFKRWIRTTGDLIMVLLVLTEINPVEAIKAMIRRSAYVLIPFSIVLIKYFRDIGVTYSEDGATTMWIGVTTHKNVLGYVILVCAMYFVNNLLVTWKSKKGFIDFLFLVMMLWIMVGTSDSKGSSTSLSALALGLIVLLAAHWGASNLMKLRKIILSIALAICFLMAISQVLGGSFLEVVTSSMGRDVTLTGRTEIWDVALSVGPGNPVFGRGYGSFWIGETANQVWNNLTYHTHFLQSHNGYIDIYLELGALGLIFLAGLIRSAWQNTGETLKTNIEYGMYRMAFLLAILLHNLTESSYGRPNHLLWFMFLLSCVYVTASFDRRGLMNKPKYYTAVR